MIALTFYNMYCNSLLFHLKYMPNCFTDVEVQTVKLCWNIIRLIIYMSILINNSIHKAESL